MRISSETIEQIQQIFSQFGVEPIGFAPFSVVRAEGKRPPSDGIQTVIMAVFPYLSAEPYQKTNLCLYARLPDYHQVIKTLLTPVIAELQNRFPEAAFFPFADNSPVREVMAAAITGLGCIGKNGLLITPKYGSYVFLGGVMTDMELECEVQPPASCEECGLCFSACPTATLSEGGLNPARCLSAITQKKGSLSEEEQHAIRKSGMVWGCDACQLVCPMNRDALLTPLQVFTQNIHPILTEADLDGNLSDRAFIWRGVEVLQRNLELTRRSE